ncbi:MAG TPA: AsnC family protein [Alphaproteobacteria bacterium]|nr:AsnC family protein [Alphaproteobacteria bacterium]
MERLSERERTVLGLIEDGLPLTARPYRALAEQVGLPEATVIEAIGTLARRGVIKRFGLVVRHHELGYRANAMVVWNVPNAEVAEVGRLMATFPFVTLCYRRPRRLPDWPYNLFCMIHAKDHAEARALTDDLADDLGLETVRREILFSRRRFKQRGARYCRPGGVA